MSEPRRKERRHYEVAMSVEALASAWARTEDAPDGSIVVAEREISGRLRGGTPWRTAGEDALIMAMVIRPAIDPLQEALLWLVATLGAADAVADITGNDHTVIWPDTVMRSENDARNDWTVQCSVNVSTQLGPGRIEHAVLAVRTHLDGFGLVKDHDATREQLLNALEHHLQMTTRLIESDALALLERFNDRCSVMNRRAVVSLLPRGEARGRVTAVDKDGFLVLESATGMLERVAPASLRSLELIN